MSYSVRWWMAIAVAAGVLFAVAFEPRNVQEWGLTGAIVLAVVVIFAAPDVVEYLWDREHRGGRVAAVILYAGISAAIVGAVWMMSSDTVVSLALGAILGVASLAMLFNRSP